MERGSSSGRIARAAHGLAIDGDHIPGLAGDRALDPPRKAGFELHRVEPVEDPPQRVVGGSAMFQPQPGGQPCCLGVGQSAISTQFSAPHIIPHRVIVMMSSN